MPCYSAIVLEQEQYGNWYRCILLWVQDMFRNPFDAGSAMHVFELLPKAWAHKANPIQSNLLSNLQPSNTGYDLIFVHVQLSLHVARVQTS